MSIDVLILSFAIWALALGPVATSCNLTPIDGRFGGAGIVRATSVLQQITLYFQGSPAQIDCVTVEVARATVEAGR